MEDDHEAKSQAGSIYGWQGLEADPLSDDYPLTALCVCGLWLIKETITDPWRHREPGEVIDGPAPTSGGWLP